MSIRRTWVLFVLVLIGFSAVVPAQGPASPPPAAPEKTANPVPPPLPRMVDLGKKWCIPCKKMVAVLQEAELRYRGKAVIEFIDLDEKPEAAARYQVMMIPTQIFYSADGKEVERHMGYLSFEEVEKIFEKMGVERSS
ncbi:MAG: thioredoxin family protein [Acidobacteriota bacterium]